jgi:NAD(P)-dependent dehydrogenase (short-subunit alcohol dehydrogenase family)
LRTHLTGKRVLILGAETEIGRAVTTAVAEAGASVAAIAATSDAEAAFTVQRLARRLSSGERKVIAQAIDATNETAVRVMVRQVSKELGGLDTIVTFAPSFADLAGMAPEHAVREASSRHINWMLSFERGLKVAEREFNRAGGGKLVSILPPGGVIDDIPPWVVALDPAAKPPDQVAADVAFAIAGEPDSG